MNRLEFLQNSRLVVLLVRRLLVQPPYRRCSRMVNLLDNQRFSLLVYQRNNHLRFPLHNRVEYRHLFRLRNRLHCPVVAQVVNRQVNQVACPHLSQPHSLVISRQVNRPVNPLLNLLANHLIVQVIVQPANQVDNQQLTQQPNRVESRPASPPVCLVVTLQ